MVDKYSMECDCDEYKENMKIIDMLCTIADIHDIKYSIEVFRYCPWCGSKLKKKRCSFMTEEKMEIA